MEERILGERFLRRIVPVAWMTLATLAVIVLVAACGLGEPYVSVIEGNYSFGQGQYQNATVHYLQALSKGSYGSWVSYDLGNVYHSLGESDAALALWKKAADTSDSALQFGVAYNQGVQYYELGDYQKAYDSFRRALSFDSSNINAKVNLELSLQKLQPATEGATQQSGTQGGAAGISEQDSRRVLDYVRRKEAQEWVPGRKQQPHPAAHDW